MTRLMVLLTFLAMSPPGLFELPGERTGAPFAHELTQVGDRCSELHRDLIDALFGDENRGR
jgi:hypothetical protein